MTDPAPSQPALSEEGLREISERETAITPGPWSIEYKKATNSWYLVIPDYIWNHGRFWLGSGDAARDHATFIAASREDVATLLAELRRVRDSIEKLHTDVWAEACVECENFLPCKTLRIIRGESDA